MKSLSFLACLLVSFSLSAQTINQSISFNPSIEDTCSAGNDIVRPEHFIAYQTLDNTEDGEVDATTCLEWTNQGLQLEGADLSRPVFVRLVDFELELPENRLLMFNVGDNSSDFDLLDFGNQLFCADGLCNGMKIEVQIPDELGEGTALRKWQQEFLVLPFTEDEFYDEEGMILVSGFTMCLPTEYFEGQIINDCVLKMMFLEETTEFNLFSLRILSVSNVDYIYNSTVIEYQGNVGYEFQYGWGQGSADYVFKHDGDSYPSPENRTYIDFYPVSDPNVQQTVQLHFDQYSVFTADPYTYLRGGLVEGQDSIRHNLSIINEGAMICFNSYYDIIIQEGWDYTHRSGKFDFQGGSACLQLNGGSNMLISENGLRYGQVGQGMFALYGGSEILLEPNAHLHFDGKLLLANHLWDTEFVPVVMTLKSGAKLTFSEFAKLEDLTGGNTKLLIRNQGGTVDLTNLTEEERSSIELVNEEVETKHITLLGNPVALNTMLSFLLFEDGKALLRILDANGKLMLETEMGQTSPLINLPLKGFPAGAYLLQVKQQTEIRTERFVIN